MPDTSEPTTDQTGDPFLVALSKSVSSTSLSEASQGLADVLEAVEEHRQTGTLSLKIKFKPHGNVARAVDVTTTVTATPPKPAPIEKIAYAHGGRLHRSDPLQPHVPGIRAVDDDVDEAARGFSQEA